jgi:3',5'-cyclic AMP phosphodiesterase CpdA
MAVLLHISDPHFGTEVSVVVEALRRFALELKADALVLTGDVTQRARRGQFSAARQFCDSLGAQHLIAVPGNHDIPLFDVLARVAFPYAGYRAAFGEDLEPVLELSDAVLIGVNTTRPERHKDGEVSTAQVERVATRLRKVPPAKLRVVLTHQPACVIRPQDEKNLLHGGSEAVRAWAEAGADLVLGGHIHLPYLGAVPELVRQVTRTLYCVQAGTALSRRVRYGTPNSVNVVKWESPPDGGARKCVVEQWDFHLADGRFELARPYHLDLAQ